MKKTFKILAITLLTGIGMYSCNSGESDNTTVTGDTLNRTDNNAAMNDKDGMPDVSAWPERPRLAVKEMSVKYGAT
jgi:hypothetical protein